MPTGLTIFAAKYLVFVSVALAAVVLVALLWPRPRLAVLRWLIAAGILLGVSYALAQLGGALYSDPRPFVGGHVHPLIAHAPDNGFPSDHALLAAALVGLVALANVWWSLPFVVLAVLVDWARVGAGIHHVADVVGSSLFVAVALLIALVITPHIVRWVRGYLPSSWESGRLVGSR